MRIFSSVSLTLLAVVNCMVHDEIREKGTEGNIAVITCSYTAGYEGYSKYFCKGLYKDCKTLIKTNGKDEWTHEGRVSLHDNTEKRKIVVTITDLRMEDAGSYGCGIEKFGQDPFTLVSLSVVQAPKPPPTTTTQSTTSATTVYTHKTPDEIVYIGAGLAALLLLFAVLLFVLIKQVKQRKAAKHQPETAPPSWNQHLHHNPHTENVSKYSPAKTSYSASQRTPSIQNTPTANRRSQADPSSAVYSNISAPPHNSCATVNFTSQPDDLNYSSVIFVRESDSNTSHMKTSPMDTARSSSPVYSTINPTNSSQSEDTNKVIYATMK